MFCARSGALGNSAAVASGLVSELVSVVENLGAFDHGSVQVLGRLHKSSLPKAAGKAMKRSPSFQSPLC